MILDKFFDDTLYALPSTFPLEGNRETIIEKTLKAMERQENQGSKTNYFKTEYGTRREATHPH